MKMYRFDLLLEAVRESEKVYRPESLSIVLITMDEFSAFLDDVTIETALRYSLLAHLGFNCANDSFDPYRTDRRELAMRCEHESWRLQHVASQCALPAGDYKCIVAMMRNIRTRSFVFKSALHPG